MSENDVRDNGDETDSDAGTPSNSSSSDDETGATDGWVRVVPGEAD